MQQIVIESVESVIVDLPLRRLQRFSAMGTKAQSVVLIRIRSQDGAVGTGETTVPGGPWWSGESVESVKIHVDTYMAELLIGRNAFDVDALLARLDGKVYGNNFAKAGIEMALLDLVARTLDQPLHNLLGGRVRDSLRTSWPLATGDPAQEIDEALERIESGLHRHFKLKMGALPVDEDVARACKIAQALENKATLRVDPNERWDESTARRAIDAMAGAGVELVEQPLPRWDHGGSARLTARVDPEIMIDEGMTNVRDVVHIAELRAAGTLSLKIMKSGGMRRSQTIARTAESLGLSLYMGTFLETSYGTAAGMQFCATLDKLPYGGELIGPLLMAEDLCEAPVEYRDFRLWLPEGPGTGRNVDAEKLRAFRRDRDYSVHAVAS